MNGWRSLPGMCRGYLVGVYLAAIPFTMLCWQVGTFSRQWLLLTAVSVFVSTINVRLPRSSVVISMGDVFTVLALLHFGPAPALTMYWIDISAATLSDQFRRYGRKLFQNVFAYRFLFNVSSCAITVWLLHSSFEAVRFLRLTPSADLLAALFLGGLVWFLTNTTLLSLAVALSSERPFQEVWKEGAGLYLVNFLGSVSAAGLLTLFYRQAGFYVLLLSVPIGVVFYQLYRVYIDKYEAATQHIGELNRLYLQTIEAMASAVDAKDKYTHGHIRRVQSYAILLARCLGVQDEKGLMAIRAGALLHDIGKIAIPEYILNKPTVLTEAEYQRMKFHPVVGANILGSIDFPYPVVPIVRSHHERWDGNGYPEGLKGDDIPLGARILSLVDCYDALTTDRPYRTPMPRQKIVEFFQQEAGGAYDPNVVDAFVKNIVGFEEEGKNVATPDVDIWGLSQTSVERGSEISRREVVHPAHAYSAALDGKEDMQRELCALHEFSRSSASFLTSDDVLTFIGFKLGRIVEFTTAVFYLADFESCQVVARHVVGEKSVPLGLTLSLDQKLSGWVAANRQALCNLPPFPDFLNCPEPKPQFDVSIVAPMTSRGVICGSIAAYRNKGDFTQDEFRRLEIVATQTAYALRQTLTSSSDVLRDEATGLPKSTHLHLVFDQVAADAERFGYSVAVISFQLEGLRRVMRRLGVAAGVEMLRRFSAFLKVHVRGSDLLVRYSDRDFVIVSPRMNDSQAHALTTRIKSEMEHLRCEVWSGAGLAPDLRVGIASLPTDGTTLDDLLAATEDRARSDHRGEYPAHIRRITT